MLQDPNAERVIKNYIDPLQKQISMMQIELEALKQQCNIGTVSGSLHIDFGVWLTGHDKETIEQMFIDWHKRQ